MTTNPTPADAVREAPMTDTFNGDNAHLIECIAALLSLDAAGALVPHGIGGHARKLLESAASRLAALAGAAPVAWRFRYCSEAGIGFWRYSEGEPQPSYYTGVFEFEKQPLFTHAPAKAREDDTERFERAWLHAIDSYCISKAAARHIWEAALATFAEGAP